MSRSTSTVPIPETAWARLREFLESGRTGKIVLNVKDGRVLSWEVREHGRVSSDD